MSQFAKPRPPIGGYKSATPSEPMSLGERAIRQSHQEVPLTLQDVLSARWHKPGNKFMRSLEMLATGQNALAGIARETIGPRSGNVEGLTSAYKAALRGIRDAASFKETAGEYIDNENAAKAVGFTADMIVDPINFVPISKPLGLAGKGLGVAGHAGEALIKKSETGAKILNKAKGATDKVERSVYARFNPDKLLAKGGFHRVLIFKQRMLGKRNFLRAQILDDAEKKIVDLVPDGGRRSWITKHIIDMEPVEGELADGTIIKADPVERANWLRNLNKLSRDEKRMVAVARGALKRLEKMKIADLGESGSSLALSAGRAAGVIFKESGRAYVPRRLASRAEVVRLLRSKIEALKAPPTEFTGDLRQLKGLSAADRKAELAFAEEQLKMFERMPEALNTTYADQIEALWQGKLSSWQEIRKLKGPIKDMDQMVQDTIETDIAKILNLERREVMRALSAQNFLTDTMKYLFREELAVHRNSKKAIAAPGRWKPVNARVVEWMEKSGKGGPLTKVTHDLNDILVPSEVADELNRALKTYLDPKSIKEAHSIWRNATKFYKAWTLAPFPGYHARNLMSNVWQNYLAGMRPQHTHHYGAAAALIKKFEKGDFTGERVLRHYTDRQLYELALKHRILEGGTYAEFADRVQQAGKHPREMLERVLSPDPGKNIFVEKGFEAGRFIENNARLTHFLWQLAEGKTPQKAARSVRKYLFDYEHGLSDFEKNIFRDRLFPFYAWTRFNLPLQLEMIARDTRSFAGAGKIATEYQQQDWAGPEPDETMFQEWLRNAQKIRLYHDKKTGDYRYFFLGGFWPGSEIEKVMTGKRAIFEAMNMLTPYIRVPGELLANYNLFQGRKIRRMEGETGHIRLGVPAVSYVGEAFAPGKFSVNTELDVRLEHLLRSMRVLNESDKLLGEFNAELGGGLKSGTLRMLFGKTYPVNVDKQRRKWAYEINFRIAELSAVRSWGEVTKNQRNIDKATAEIEKLRALKKELGINSAHELEKK